MMNFLIQKVLAIGGEGSGANPPIPNTPSSSGGDFKIQPPAGIPQDICAIINNVTNFIMIIAIPIAGLMILYAAFLILTAAENPKRFEDGKNTIIYTVIGLVIILLAKGLVVLITQLLGVGGGGLCSATP